MATRVQEFPNQIQNTLGFPFQASLSPREKSLGFGPSHKHTRILKRAGLANKDRFRGLASAMPRISRGRRRQIHIRLVL